MEDYRKYTKRVLSNPLLTDLLPDKKVHKIRASSNHKVPYVTYLFYDEGASFIAEGKEKKTKYYIQIDINSNTDFSDIEDAIRAIAKEERWSKGAIFEDVDPETKLLFKCMRFTFDL